jgi:TnpA family transposase
VTSSLILRKLASYPRQNALALVLREFGRIERTLFTLDWLLDKDLRQRVTAGLDKGELKNSLAKAVCFNRLGNCATAALRGNVTAQAASTSWSPRLSCGIPFIWSV